MKNEQIHLLGRARTKLVRRMEKKQNKSLPIHTAGDMISSGSDSAAAGPIELQRKLS